MMRKHRRFVDHYLADLNATQAAIRAGYSPKSAYVQGCRLLKYPHVAEAVEEGLKKRAARLQITQDRVLDEIAAVAFSRVSNYVVDDDGRVEVEAAARPDSIAAVSSIKRKRREYTRDDVTTVETDVEIRLWDKVNALKLAGQHLGMFKDTEPVLNPLDVARAVREAVRSMNEMDGLDAA